MFKTLHSLHEWYVSLFEKLGWMILAQRDGKEHKIEHYKLQIEDFIEAVEARIQVTEEKDRRIDLGIMLKNIKTLRDHVDKDF